MAEDVENALRKVCEVFGHEKLNKHQEDSLRFIVQAKGDVFINLPTGYGKSLVFQALPVVHSFLEPSEKNIVIVVSPLVNLMKDQVSRLTSLGISAISLSDMSSESEVKAIENGDYSIVYGSPESWLGDRRWRKMVVSDTYQKSVRAVAVDEAHVICHWGKSKTNKHAAFREWFSRLHEFRSLLPRTPFIALTATATKDTKETIFEVLLMKDPHIVSESPNKANISYVVHYMGKTASLTDYFSWIVSELKECGSSATRTIIYCQTIKQCAVVYSTMKTLLGNNIYENSQERNPEKVLLEMLHSCSPQSNKEHILESFQSDQGHIRVLVATIAFGMGVDCKQVQRTLHFGPAKNVECYMQESGRAGRDGCQSTAFLLYQGMQLMHVEKDIKEYVKSEECRRKHLLRFFGVECPQQDPAHLCCDNCSRKCKCGSEDCKPLIYPLRAVNQPCGVHAKERNVSAEQKKTLQHKLASYHKKLLTNLSKRDASGKLKYFTHPKFVLGFSELQMQQTLDHCSKLFSISDICSLVEIWEMQHAYRIHGIMQAIFGDMEDTNTDISDEEMSDEEEEGWSSEWNDLVMDEELANMVIENLSFSQWDDSQDESVENAQVEVPFTALNAVLNLSFDAVLDS